jgi:WD40 repeat protein
MFHTATVLPDGRVLVAGGAGVEGCGLGCPRQLKATAELYDPKIGVFSRTGSMSTARWNRTATLLPNGRVLIAGGDNLGGGSDADNAISDAEVYDPTSGTFVATGSMVAARTGHTATLLPNGRVLIVGGSDGNHALTTAELYDPAAGTFSAAGSMSNARYGATATLLADGRVLISGGSANASAELYTS